MTDRNDAVPLAAVLDALNATTAELNATKAEVQRLRTYGRRNRKFIIFDIALTLALTGVGAVSVHAVQSADSANAAQSALCQAGNIARAQQVQLWGFVLNISAPAKGSPPQTPAQKARIAAFRAYLARDFASRDCSHLGQENR